MPNIVPFSFDSHQVRVVTDRQDAPWFVLRDVLEAMGSRTKNADAVESINTGIGEGYVNDLPLQTSGGLQTLIVIAEAAVTYLLSRSNTDQGRRLNRMIHAEILPTLRKTGRYEAPTTKTDDARISALKLTRLAMQAAKAFGFTGNHAALSADRAILTITGASPLALLGHEHLEANPRGQTYGLNELGQMLDPPITGVALGKKLETFGLRARDAAGNLIPTEAAAGLFEWLDTGKRSNHGAPVKQVKWFKDVLAILSPQPTLS